MHTPGRPVAWAYPSRHVAGALLVAHEDVADRRVDERVVDREDGAARKAEDRVHVEQLERAHYRLRAGELLRRYGTADRRGGSGGGGGRGLRLNRLRGRSAGRGARAGSWCAHFVLPNDAVGAFDCSDTTKNPRQRVLNEGWRVRAMSLSDRLRLSLLRRDAPADYESLIAVHVRDRMRAGASESNRSAPRPTYWDARRVVRR